LTTSKKHRIKSASVIIAASFIITQVLFLIFPRVLDAWNNQTVDRLFLLRATLNPPAYDSSIVHIDITNSSIEKLSYYFPRRYYGDVVSALHRMKFSAIAFDIIFAQKVNREDDSVLAASVRESNQVYFPVAFSLEQTDQKFFTKSNETIKFLDSSAWTVSQHSANNFYHAGTTLLTWPDLSREARGIGFISAQPDLDGVFRKVPLVIRYKDKFYPSMMMRLACDRFNVTPDRITITGGHSIVLRGAQIKENAISDIVIPIDENGNMIINWIGGWDAMRHMSFAQLLEVADDRDEVEAFAEEYSGSIGIFGDVSTGISDVGPTPFEQNFPLVGLHANTLNTILTQQFLSALPLRFMTMIEVCIAALIVMFAARFSSVQFTFFSVSLLVMYFIAAALLFVYAGIILQIIRPMMTGGFAITAIVAYWYITEEKEKEKIRSKFETYFPPTIVKQMIDNPDALTTTPRRQEVTVMFSDIKSFTTYSSTMTPEEISATLNEYFGAMIDIVFRYGGTVDKFIGDGLMVFYGAPEPQPDHALRCVKAAIEMQQKCRELKAQWEPIGRLPIRIRIGINTGPVVVGDLGSKKRMEYTVLGSDVNLAQRLESNAPIEGIMISEATYRYVKDLVRTKPLEPIIVKGLDTPITVYEVLVD